MVCGGWNDIYFVSDCTAPGLGDRILGEEQTLLLMGTGGLEPKVALALLSLFCVVVVCSLSCSFVSSLLFVWAMFICNLVRF